MYQKMLKIDFSCNRFSFTGNTADLKAKENQYFKIKPASSLFETSIPRCFRTGEKAAKFKSQKTSP